MHHISGGEVSSVSETQPEGALVSPGSAPTPLDDASPDLDLGLPGRRPGLPVSGYVGTAVIALLVLAAVIGPWVEPLSPSHQDFTALLQSPRGAHPLGTDQLGRDVLSRLLSGARISLLLGVTVVLCSGIVGAVVGLVAGFVGGLVESAFMRLADLFLAFPKLILAIAVSASLGPSLKNLLIAVSLTWWPEYARLARSVVIVLKHAEYVDAARVLGVPRRALMTRHMLPAVIPQIVVKGTMDVGFSIVYIAGLSFIGLGIQPPTAEWGLMVADGRQSIQSAWWVSTFPGLAILLAGLAFNLAGEAIRDALDPRRVKR